MASTYFDIEGPVLVVNAVSVPLSRTSASTDISNAAAAQGSSGGRRDSS